MLNTNFIQIVIFIYFVLFVYFFICALPGTRRKGHLMTAELLWWLNVVIHLQRKSGISLG